LSRPARIVLVWLGVGWIVCILPARLSAQVFEVNGGNSSLYQAGGGSVTVRAPSYNFTIGAGTVDGHLLEGARMIKVTPRGTFLFGDDRVDFRLPTDIFDTSHYLLMRGVGFSGVRHGADILAFAGATSLDYGSPFFNGAKATDPAGLLFLSKRLTPDLKLFSDTVVSSKLTQIVALEWTPARKMAVGYAAGVGANQFFGALSLNLSRPRFDLQAAYILAGQEFHRITVQSPLLAEPDKENIFAVVRPTKFLTVSGGRQNYLVPQYPSPVNARSSIDQGSASLNFLGTQLNGTFYHSSYNLPSAPEASNHALALSAIRDFTPRIRLAANYLVSKPKGTSSTESLIANLSETLTSHLAVTESLTYSNGHTSINFGGEILSNRLTFSASYQTFYVPAQNSQPFEQALLLDLKFRVLGRLLLHGANFVDPTGRVRYTADGSGMAVHSETPASHEPSGLGRYLLAGCVVDSRDQPVEGAAILIDDTPLYTDSAGCFSMYENRPHTHRLGVALDGFLSGGEWEVISKPATISSTNDARQFDPQVIVTVRRIHTASAGSPAAADPGHAQKP
jgi:hypothetical protein